MLYTWHFAGCRHFGCLAVRLFGCLAVQNPCPFCPASIMLENHVMKNVLCAIFLFICIVPLQLAKRSWKKKIMFCFAVCVCRAAIKPIEHELLSRQHEQLMQHMLAGRRNRKARSAARWSFMHLMAGQTNRISCQRSRLATRERN